MPTGVVKTKADESIWSTAKSIVAKHYGLTEKDGSKFWASVNGLFQSMKKRKKKRKKVASFLIALASELQGLPEGYPEKDPQTGKWVKDIATDKFYHFTSPENAQQIIKDKLLSWDKVGTGPNRGISAICAVSAVWGYYVKSVHVGSRPEESTVAVEFTTDDKPDYGYVEEVLWHRDVHLKEARIIPTAQAKQVLLGKPKFPEMNEVTYK